MGFKLEGSVAVVTGAAHGIGAALSLELARRKCHLALVDRDAETLDATASAAQALGVNVSRHYLDITDADAVTALPTAVLAAHGRVGLVINNAGVALMGDVEQLTLEDIEWLFNINFWGVVRSCKAFLPVLRMQPHAHIVNLSSVFGLIAPAGQSAYCASKFAVRGFSDALRHELEGSSIGVSTVHPGGIKTRIAHHSRRAALFDERQAAQLADKFWREVRTTPAQAAACIVKGIERGAPRILIGGDARVIDWLSRLAPIGYWRLLRKFFVIKPKTTGELRADSSRSST